MATSRAEMDRRMRRFANECRQSGLKVTHQRTEIYRELACSEEHPDAETIYERVRRRVPAISRDTVYRTLSALEERGLVRKAGVLFHRGRYDANIDQHHHFVCTDCGLIRDVPDKALGGLELPTSLGTLGRVESAHVQLRGVCSDCSRRNTLKRRGK